MLTNSIDIVEDWLGDSFSAKTIELVVNAPDEQLPDLGFALAQSYYGWDDQWRAKPDQRPELLFVGDEYDSADPERARWVSRVKTASLLFDNIAFEDPLSSELYPLIEASNLGIGFEAEDMRGRLRRGLSSLLEVHPLTQSGAVALVPRSFLGVLPDVQDLARKEYSGPTWDENADERLVQGHAALLSALCGTFELSPIAGNEGASMIIGESFERFRRRIATINLEFEKAVNRYSIPNVSRLPISEIAGLRDNSEAFAAFRDQIRAALRQAHAADATIGGDRFGPVFLEELGRQRDRVRAELTSSDVLNSLIIPGSVTVGIGALSLYLDPSLYEDRDKLAIAIAGMGAPGITWIVTLLTKRLSKKHREATLLAEIYGSLLETPQPCD